MKKILLTVAFTGSVWTGTFAQATRNGDLPAGTMKETNVAKNASGPRACRKLYLGLSGGINNPAGFIGVDIDVPVLYNLSIDGGFGNSTWGNKSYAGIRFYLKECHRGWAFGAGVSHSGGIAGLKQNLETVYGQEDVILNLKPQTNMFLGAYYFCKLGKGANKFYITGGYSIPFSDYSYTETSGDPLTEISDKVIKFISPHGIMMGVGFSFAILK